MLLILLSLIGTSIPVTAGDPVEIIRAENDGVSVHISVPEPGFASTGTGVYPVLAGAGLSSREGDYLRPAYIFCIPVPPGVSPSVEYAVSATGLPRAVPGPWARTPVLEGTGLDTREREPVSPLPSAADPVEVNVMRLAGTTMAVVSVLPFHGTSLSVYDSEITVSLRWPVAGNPVSSDGTLAGLVALQDLPVWPCGTADQGDGGRQRDAPGRHSR